MCRDFHIDLLFFDGCFCLVCDAVVFLVCQLPGSRYVLSDFVKKRSALKAIFFSYSGKIREKISSKAAYFHLVSWSVPLVLTITCMALAQVDAQSPHGICFVGNGSPAVRSSFVLAPVVLLLVVGHVFLFKGLIVLVRLRLGSADVISPSASSKLRDTIVRLVSFSITVVFCVVLTLFCHIYEFGHQDDWKTSFRSYMV